MEEKLGLLVCRSSSMFASRTWEDYRQEEMEEKAGMLTFPEEDMDGRRFIPIPDAKWELAAEDAYFESLSGRLYARLSGMNKLL